ncbi:ATP synthase A chain [Azotobacter beijerinckii]|uniref:ATP synthase A chain n=1 Tax=Azotobacter beijerinckii TaxID=170623 RepID=A0A1I4CKY5_9GAMM|nr:F0F1 ATP synthase subunit A [Azotobacter beijerinckii]SFB37412.1 ATP synthase A chain [Azotobacter beijerinckii]SFK81290.1 ATP synthase A chain [Azotobacter beijerinckii]
MTSSPLTSAILFQLGPVPISKAVAATWLLLLVLGGGSWLLTRRLSLRPSRGQSLLELLVATLDEQIRATMQVAPEPYRALLGTLFLFILAANWSELVPGLEPPPPTWRPTPPWR